MKVSILDIRKISLPERKRWQKVLKQSMMEMEDGAGVDDRHKTSSDKLQYGPTLDSQKPNKHVVVEWLPRKCHCTHN